MLYISTRNINDSYTAYRALHEEFAPNGGQIDFGVGVFQGCERLTTIVLPATLSAFDGSVRDI